MVPDEDGAQCDQREGAGIPTPPSDMGSDLGEHPLVGMPLLRVRMPDDTWYPGDLLDDILSYRELRVHVVRGNPLDDEQTLAFQTLEERLRSADLDEFGAETSPRSRLRAYHRFRFKFEARLRVRSAAGSRLFDVSIENISAGGVKINGHHGCTAGESVWLLVPRGDRRVVVMPSRVAWVGPDTGLMFAGAASC